MTPIYLLNGKLLLRNGKLATSDNCCCTPTLTPTISLTPSPTPPPDPCWCLARCTIVNPESDNNMNISDNNFNDCTKETKTSRYSLLGGAELITAEWTNQIPGDGANCALQWFVEISYGYISVTNNVPPKTEAAKTEYASLSWNIKLVYIDCPENIDGPVENSELVILDPTMYATLVSYNGGLPEFILNLLPQGAPVPSQSLASDIINTWSGQMDSGWKNSPVNTTPSDCANDIQIQPAPELGLMPEIVCF
jgi:hypothetical protein